MLRSVLCSLFTLALCLGAAAVAEDKKDDKAKDGKKGAKARITNIDKEKQTVTVKMKDKEGKETEKTFKLARTVRYIDSTGKVVAADVFRSGDYVLVFEVAGQIEEIRQDKDGDKGDSPKGKDKKDKKKDGDRKDGDK